MTPDQRAGLLPLAAVATTLLLWASAFVAIRHLADTFSPGSLTLGRVGVASIALGIGVLASGWVRPTTGEWVRLVAIGVLWFAIYNVALNAGEHHVDAGTAALLIQLSPLLVALISVAFLGEHLSLPLLIGIGVAFSGVALIAFADGPGGNRDLLGVGLVLLSATVYAISAVLQKPLVARLSAIQVTWVAATVGTIATLPWAPELVRQTGAASLDDVGWVVYLGLFPTAIAFTTFAFALKHMSATNLSVTTYLVPPIVVLISWLFLGEVPPAVAYLGGALCLIGVAVARRTKPVPATPADAPPVRV